MKLLTLAIASIVDANLNQGYTRQLTGSKPAQHSSQYHYGDQTGLNSFFKLLGWAVGRLTQISDIISERRKERQGIGQLLRLNGHLLEDIGLQEFDLQGLRTGSITLDEIKLARDTRFAAMQPVSKRPVQTVKKSIVDLQSANQESFELAKCS